MELNVAAGVFHPFTTTITQRDSYLAFNEEQHQISDQWSVWTPLLSLGRFEILRSLVVSPEQLGVEEVPGSLGNLPV